MGAANLDIFKYSDKNAIPKFLSAHFSKNNINIRNYWFLIGIVKKLTKKIQSLQLTAFPLNYFLKPIQAKWEKKLKYWIRNKNR